VAGGKKLRDQVSAICMYAQCWCVEISWVADLLAAMFE